MTRTARVVNEFSALDERAWSLLDHQDNPFLSYAFLNALETAACVQPETGWQPHHLCLFEEEQLVACAPSYLKSHSHGEFVFDWSWADAYHRHGRAYYPKLLTAVPYSPVPGPRLLVQRGHKESEALQAELIDLALTECDSLQLSSWHCNFTPELTLNIDQSKILLPRNDWQFHWFNQGFSSFADFLSCLRSKKRKNIRRDRRMVEQAGIRFERKSGDQLSPVDLDFIMDCYQATFLDHGNHPALNRSFFEQLAVQLKQGLLTVMALQGNEPLAMSLYLVGGGRLYGRYWGCMKQFPGLHFETAYHQGIEFCIDRGLDVFEPGAQGEHKISRGFTPVRTYSYHHVRDEAFRTAIARYLEQEQGWMEDYRHQLAARTPFRMDDGSE